MGRGGERECVCCGGCVYRGMGKGSGAGIENKKGGAMMNVEIELNGGRGDQK